MTRYAAPVLGACLVLISSGCGDRPSYLPPVDVPPPAQPPAACLATIPPVNADPNRPVITLKGPRAVNQPVGVPYADAGATAVDPADGDVSSRIVVAGLDTLATAARGDFLIRYNVTDSRGLAATEAVRVVRVTDGGFVRQTRRDYGTTRAVMGYFERLPPNYSDEPARSFPLIIYHHGYGENADFTQVDADQWAASPDKLDLLLRRGLSGIIDHGRWDDSRPFIVLSPQRCIAFGDNEISSFVRYALTTYAVDPSRVYMMGFSAGAFVTWQHVLLHPDELAAAVTISGGGNTSASAGCVMRDTPTWSFHARDDQTVPVADSINTVASIDACSPAVPHRLTVFPSGGHLIDIATLELTLVGQGEPQYDVYDQDLYTWLAQSTRTSVAAHSAGSPRVALASRPEMKLWVAPEAITAGRRATLKWSSERAESCWASGDWVGPRPASGAEAITPPAPGSYNYVLTCTGAGGAVAQSVSLRVEAALRQSQSAGADGEADNAGGDQDSAGKQHLVEGEAAP
jgi:predicted esterase